MRLGDIPYNFTDRVLLPTWHSYPVVPRYPPYNWDYFSSTEVRGIAAMLDHNMVSFSEPYLLPDPNDPAQVHENEVWEDFFRDYVAPDVETTEPPLDIYFPLFDSLDSVKPGKNETLVAMITSTIYVRDIVSLEFYFVWLCVVVVVVVASFANGALFSLLRYRFVISYHKVPRAFIWWSRTNVLLRLRTT
jgi:hypothetical protein